MEDSKQVSLGTYLASRLVEVGCRTAFAVPGDFTLTLLDQLLLKKPELQMVWNSNELGAGYAADGYARINGIGACCVTFCVGGFSAINAIAGAYAEDLPVIVISGGPNSNDYAANHILHHTVGVPEFGQQLRAYREVTCAQVVIQHLSEAHHQIDFAISEALRHRKPAYIEICCNLAGLTHPSFLDPPVPFALTMPHTNQHSLQAAVDAAVAVLGSAAKPVLLGGPRLRANGRRQAFAELAKASKYAVALTPDGKGMFPEDDESFVGIYWGSVSWPYCMEVVEASDVVITVGCVWTDYSTVGYSLLLDDTKAIKVEDDRVTIKGGKTFGCVAMEDFLQALAAAVKPNTTALEKFRRMADPQIRPADGHALAQEGDELTSKALYRHIQGFLSSEQVVVAEVGDALFQANKLRLPRGAGHEIQLRYGSIGWSVGAVLGASLALQPKGRRVVGIIGDGSFQMTAQEVSTMLRFGATPVIILVNNGGYAIESEIHDGEYNVIQNWDYTKLAQAMHNGNGRLWTPDSHVRNETQLAAALEAADGEHKDKLCFIEVVIDREDTSPELLEWGARVAAANSRPPKPQ